jgi:hypothetical protein
MTFKSFHNDQEIKEQTLDVINAATSFINEAGGGNIDSVWLHWDWDKDWIFIISGPDLDKIEDEKNRRIKAGETVMGMHIKSRRYIKFSSYVPESGIRML